MPYVSITWQQLETWRDDPVLPFSPPVTQELYAIAEQVAWSHRKVETEVGLSEPGTVPFFKSAEFKLQAKAQKVQSVAFVYSSGGSTISSSALIWGIRKSQNAAILIKAWCMYI